VGSSGFEAVVSIPDVDDDMKLEDVVSEVLDRTEACPHHCNQRLEAH